MLLKITAARGKLHDTKLDPSAFDRLSNGFRRAFKEGEFDKGMQLAKRGNHGRKQARADRGYGTDREPSAA